MAHFAELDANNVVLRVIVVDTKDNSTAEGVEKESIGQAFCERLFGGRWIQTSYNNNFRKVYAGIGYTYDPILDEFVAPFVASHQISDLTSNQIPAFTSTQIAGLTSTQLGALS